MAVIVRDVNEVLDSTEFKPFNDSTDSLVRDAATQTAIASGSNRGINTREIDQFRQGIEIDNNQRRFLGTSPKIWAGNIKGYTRIQTLGDRLSFTDFEETKVFEETIRYNPVSYILSTEDVWFNDTIDDVPIENKEANLQPLTIKDRDGKGKDKDPSLTHSVKGNLGEGNESNYNVFKSTSTFQQYIDFNNPNTNVSYFCDDLEQWKIVSGTSYTYLDMMDTRAENDNKHIPFNDTKVNKLLSKLNTTNVAFINALTGSDINLDEELRQIYDRKSTTAGTDVYGPYVNEFGTDSIAYSGWLLGN